MLLVVALLVPSDAIMRHAIVLAERLGMMDPFAVRTWIGSERRIGRFVCLVSLFVS